MVLSGFSMALSGFLCLSVVLYGSVVLCMCFAVCSSQLIYYMHALRTMRTIRNHCKPPMTIETMENYAEPPKTMRTRGEPMNYATIKLMVKVLKQYGSVTVATIKIIVKVLKQYGSVTVESQKKKQ